LSTSGLTLRERITPPAFSGRSAPITSSGSVTSWIRQLKAGDRAAVQQLWERYFRRLVGLARKKLQGAPRRAADEEDVALSAFKSFCRGAEEDRFPQLLDKDDLWQLLVLLTLRKAANLANKERRQKRGGGNVRNASALAGDDSSEAGNAFTNLISREPDPRFAAELAEKCRDFLQRLGDEEQRAVAVWKMEGYTNAEIAAKLGRSEPTVERKLRLIRNTWQKDTDQ
jgi:DNA-directed RNA polymerase specialized sigma24 family protein